MLAAIGRPYRASVSWSPLDPRWYDNALGSGRSDAGVNVTADTAVGQSVIFRGINVLAHAIASVPLQVYRTLDDDGKEKAKSHPAYRLLHDKPNAWMTSFRWRHLMICQRILHGDHYSEILPGPGGVGQLAPLSPLTTRIVDQFSDGRLLYVTRDETEKGFGPERKILQDELLHIRGFSRDGKKGIPLPSLARNTIGLALAAEKHGSMFLRKGAQLSGILTTESALDEPNRAAAEKAWQRSRGGPQGSGTTPVLAGGFKYQSISSNNKDSQWIEARTFQVEEILRWIGVPGVLCGYADKTATYASAEQFFLSFVKFTVAPLAVEIAQELNESVIVDPENYFCEFNLDGLERGDLATRYAAHNIAIQAGFKTRNEVRKQENLNAGPPELDTFLEMRNMSPAGQQEAQQGRPQPAPAPRDDDEEEEDDDDSNDTASKPSSQHLAIVRRSVERVVRKELQAIAGTGSKLGAAKRHAGNPAAWKAWVEDFYGKHAAVVSDELGLTANEAATYCNYQRAHLDASIGASDTFERDSVTSLLALLNISED